MSAFRPDPEFWKNLYGDRWQSAADAVKVLHAKIVERYPDLADSVKFGLGATTGKKVRIPSEEKHAPDITYYFDYKLLCYIEVTAPERGRVPPGDIWLLQGKYKRAVAKEAMSEKTWFYFSYPLTGKSYVLDVQTVGPFEKKVATKHLKRDAQGEGVPEVYIEIPPSKAKDENALLDWLAQEIEARKKPKP